MPQITIDIPNAAVPRIRAAISERIQSYDEEGNPIPVSHTELLAETKRLMRERIRSEVRDYELMERAKAARDTYDELPIT